MVYYILSELSIMNYRKLNKIAKDFGIPDKVLNESETEIESTKSHLSEDNKRIS